MTDRKRQEREQNRNRNMAERGGFDKTTWKQLSLKMESTLRLRSSGSTCLVARRARSWMAASEMHLCIYVAEICHSGYIYICI